MMKQPSIEVLGISIGEPVTFATDLLITAVCFYAYFRLNQNDKEELVHFFFKYYFLLLGISTFLSGLFGHAFRYEFEPIWKLSGWAVAMFAISAFEYMSLCHAKKVLAPFIRKVFSGVILLQLVFFLALMGYRQDFEYVIFHSIIGVAIIGFPLHIYVWSHNRSVSSLWILLGILITAISSLVFAKQISLGLWFNHKDISHLVIAIGNWAFFMGAQKTIVE